MTRRAGLDHHHADAVRDDIVQLARDATALRFCRRLHRRVVLSLQLIRALALVPCGDLAASDRKPGQVRGADHEERREKGRDRQRRVGAVVELESDCCGCAENRDRAEHAVSAIQANSDRGDQPTHEGRQVGCFGGDAEARKGEQQHRDRPAPAHNQRRGAQQYGRREVERVATWSLDDGEQAQPHRQRHIDPADSKPACQPQHAETLNRGATGPHPPMG